MGYPESVLADDEHVVLHRHPHVKRLIGPILALLLATAVAAFLVSDDASFVSGQTIYVAGGPAGTIL